MNKTLLSLRFCLFFILGLASMHSSAQTFAEPRAEDVSDFGKNISRTMNLLESSTAAKKNTVKILVYGQSISEQNWWLAVKSDLTSRYPNANIIMENRAIGGFAAQLLIKPMYFDVMPFYPDLILFHVYGSQFSYDTIVSEIRKLTTAEIGLQTNHGVPGPDSSTAHWDDFMSYIVMPKAAAKYKLEMMDIRTPWGHYVTDNNITADKLTIDGLHLNDHGNFLMSRLINRRLHYNSKYPADPYRLVHTYPVGKDSPVNFSTGELTLPFRGNKVDLISAPSTGPLDSAAILIDNKKPSQFPGCYAFTRPNGIPHGGSINKITSQNILLLEDWTITINSITCSAAACRFSFSLKGSKTGDDGSGTVGYDQSGKATSSTFVSNSKRIVIRPEDWYIRQPTIAGVKIEKGFTVKWSVIPLYKDYYVFPATISDPSIENVTVAAQGIENKDHVLKIVPLGNKNVPIQAIRIYTPYWTADSALATAVQSPEKMHDLKLSPNPSYDQLHVHYPKTHGTSEVLSVYDALGQKVDIENVSTADGSTLNVRPLKEGMYFIRLEING
ncbi:MAG TPA: T9SS type A sorting domain-containing protein, partial [Cytophagaceae bacterium]